MGPYTAVSAFAMGSQQPFLPPATNPVSIEQAKTTNYLHPEASVPMDAPMPEMYNPQLVTGMYYNILFPEERQNRCKPELKKYFESYLAGATPEFLTPDQFETLNSYGLQGPPKGVLGERLAKLALHEVDAGKTIHEALRVAQATIQEKDIPQYSAILTKLQALQAQAEEGSPTHERFKLLIKAVDECVKSLDRALESTKGKFVNEFEVKGQQAGVDLLKKWGTEPPAKLSEQEQKLELFEHRHKVMAHEIKNIRAKVPNGAAFAAFQEATPDAVVELKAALGETFPTWISFNNVSGLETKVKEKEDVFGESTAFTSTLALSPELKVQRVALGSLPNLSGSERKILGVEVENTNTKGRFAIFKTHTDHVPKVYHDTAQKIHAFIKEFIQETPDMPIIFGGDLNAFEQSGAKDFIREMRQGPFEGGVDYREGLGFYAHKSIADTTYLGRESDAFKAKIKDGVLERNALDHILTKNIKVIAGTRSAVVYDAAGKLVDPFTSPDLYKERLEQRRTASDHFLNAAIFRT